MPNIQEIKQKIKSTGALLQGHFVLSSGLHSEFYVQCAQVFYNPKIATELCAILVEKIKSEIDVNKLDTIVAPAMGGVIIGYEIARQLGKKSVFCERVNGEFELRRGFTLNKGENVLVLEDVLTTGKSSIETYNCIKEHNVNILAEACLIRRNPEIKALEGVPIIPLLDFQIPTYTEKNLPENLKNIPITKPGSRFLKK
jgi:orotate phosphoribosyltransferase